MKKFFKKSLSLILAISALCILFAFQASAAVSTECQDCHGSNITYIGLGNVGEPNDPHFRHEVYCIDCSCSTGEEDCEWDGFRHDSTGHFCYCGIVCEYHDTLGPNGCCSACGYCE